MSVRKDALALAGAPVALAEQAAEPAPAAAVGGIDDDVGRAVGEDEPAAEDEPEILRHRPQLRRSEGQIGEGGVFDPDVFAGAVALLQLLRRGQPVLAQLPQRAPGPHHARHRVAVGEAQTRMAEQQRREHQIGPRRGTAQEGKIRRGNQFGEGAEDLIHANSPCRNQRGGACSGSWKPMRKSQKRRPAESSTR